MVCGFLWEDLEARSDQVLGHTLPCWGLSTLWVIAPLLELLEVLLYRRGLKGGLSMEKKREPFKRKTHCKRHVCMDAQSFSPVQLFATPWDVALLSMEFSRTSSQPRD